MTRRFSLKSEARLLTCDPVIQQIMREVLQIRDITVISGRRLEQEQNALFDTNPKRSYKRWPESKHNVRRDGEPCGPDDLCIAIDIAPWPLDWHDQNSFIELSGIVRAVAYQYGAEFVWGGNWDRDNDIMHDQSFQDLGHYELVLG